MAEDTRVICCNLCIVLPLFFIVYYMAASLLSGAFKISDFDGKTPFDFKNCCSIKDNKNLVTLLSMLLTYIITTVIIIIFLRKKVWDYAITLGLVHLVLSCAVMQAFPTNWEWWIAFLSSVLFMAVLGELVIRCFFKENSGNSMSSISPQRNLVT
ncbi:hypothetical protein OS493_009188 [Desmophyllum pertusum]|uniref:Transmembrane protein 244 n=1 Tax=Desmophyllum pertusum TaxID=174260 RepID=A0A9W9Z2M3_9CNID|nr:hypothetical protein OS493_009188 [Desmophyllum pertusum]